MFGRLTPAGGPTIKRARSHLREHDAMRTTPRGSDKACSVTHSSLSGLSAYPHPGRADRAREEMEAIAEQLAAAVGLGGRARQAASSSERARSTMTKAVKAAASRISDHHAALD